MIYVSVMYNNFVYCCLYIAAFLLPLFTLKLIMQCIDSKSMHIRFVCYTLYMHLYIAIQALQRMHSAWSPKLIYSLADYSFPLYDVYSNHSTFVS